MRKSWVGGGLIAIGLYLLGVVVVAACMGNFQMGDFMYVAMFLLVFPFGDKLNGSGEYLMGVGVILLICFLIGAFIASLKDQRGAEPKKEIRFSGPSAWLGGGLLIVVGFFSYFVTPPTYRSLSDCHSPLSSVRSGFSERDCYTQVAKVTGDISICNQFDSFDYAESEALNIEVQRQLDKYECYMEVGSLKDIRACTGIPMDDNLVANGKAKSLKSDCYLQASYNQQSCEIIRADRKEFEFCTLSTNLRYEMSKEQLSGLCTSITTPVLRQACFSYEKRDHPWWEF